jgi:hypothetical protein
MDPLTLFALANGAVKLVKEGCKLYKDIKGAAGEIKDVLKDLDDQFHNKFKDRQPTVQERNQYIEEKNRIIALNKQSGDTTNIYTEIGQQLGVYYDNYYRCIAVFEEEERRSKNEVYHGEDSLGKRALQRVLLKKQLQAMGDEIREIMVYNSPPELGSLWTEVEEMMQKVGKEQAGAIALEMQRSREITKQKARKKKRLQYKLLCWSLTSITILYFTWLVWAVVQIRIENSPDLGVCLLPKGTWPYHHYNNLKWVNCEKSTQRIRNENLNSFIHDFNFTAGIFSDIPET